MREQWSNVQGTFSFEYTFKDGVYLDNDDEEINTPPLPQCGGELVIEFQSSGYYEPASMYGGSDNLGHPAEGEDERTLVEAYVLDENNNRIDLDKQLQETLFDHFQDDIEGESLTH